MTERLYYTDPYLRTFEAEVVESAPGRVYLDRTAFYPSSGGQPFDTGTLGGMRVLDVVDDDDRIAHIVEGEIAKGTRVRGEIDWPRRFDHMQQHSGQHLLSAVLHELFDMPTLSFHLGEGSSTIDIGAAALAPEQVERAEERCNEIVLENRPVGISFEEQSADLGLRKASERDGTLRVVSIEAVDRSACGGTHVRSTGEIGPVQIRRLDKIRGTVRVEFLCGWRALRRARADYRALSAAARLFSAALDEVPAVAQMQFERAQEVEKSRKKLAIELNQYRGFELYRSTEPSASGIRAVEQRLELGDDARSLAIAFASGERAVFLGVSATEPAFLLAASKDAGVNAGAVMKAAVTAHGGRGGGSPTLAQGSVPDQEQAQAALAEIRAAVIPT